MAAVEPAGGTVVLIPAYDAGTSVGDVVAGAREALPGVPIYVVDDGSGDETGEVAAAAGAIVLRHAHNRGKGAALASGLERALAQGAKVIATLDADGQHPPEILPALLAPVRRGDADLVLGARARTRAMPAGRRFTNWLSAACASRVGGTWVPDAQTGFRAFSARLATALRPALVRHLRYDYEAVFLLGALRAGYRVRSIDVPTVYAGAASHFRSWGDSWRLARVFVRYYLGAA